MKTPPFPPSSENGIKMGLFDPTQLQYPPQLFWPPASGFTGLPLGELDAFLLGATPRSHLFECQGTVNL